MQFLSKALIRSAFAAVTFACAVPAATIFDSGVTSITNGDPTQLGRLSRSGVISDWSTQKPFPGVISPTTSYSYHVYDVAIPSYYPYVQITFDSTSANTFASAYYTSYVPNATATNRGLDVNYLGDAGASGNLFGTDPRAYQVIMPGPGNLEVVVNTSAAAGIGAPYDVLVEGFTDTSFDDDVPTAAPEPITFVMTGSALLGLVCLRRRASRA